jgi:hypothetical protein
MSKERELLKRVISGTDDGVDFFIGYRLYKDIETFLDQPEQQPEAWMLIDKETGARIPRAYKPEHGVNQDRWELYPLYASPTKRKPLSHEHLEALVDKYHGYPRTLVRTVESTHGIGKG